MSKKAVLLRPPLRTLTSMQTYSAPLWNGIMVCRSYEKTYTILQIQRIDGDSLLMFDNC